MSEIFKKIGSRSFRRFILLLLIIPFLLISFLTFDNLSPNIFAQSSNPLPWRSAEDMIEEEQLPAPQSVLVVNMALDDTNYSDELSILSLKKYSAGYVPNASHSQSTQSSNDFNYKLEMLDNQGANKYTAYFRFIDIAFLDKLLSTP